MRTRLLSALGAVTAAALAVTVLSGCTPKATEIASVGGTTFTTDDLQPYLNGRGVSKQVRDAAEKAGQTVEAPSVEVARRLIQQEIFVHILSSTPQGVPGAAELAKLHDGAVSTFLGAQQTGAQFDSTVGSQAAAYGLGPRFINLLLRTVELEAALAVRLQSSSLETFLASVAGRAPRVRLNADYGTWEAGQVTIKDPKTAPPAPGGPPGFVTIEPVGGAASTSSTPAG